jgi:hypothetical protein
MDAMAETATDPIVGPVDAVTRRAVAQGGMLALLAVLLAGWKPAAASSAPAPAEPFDLELLGTGRFERGVGTAALMFAVRFVAPADGSLAVRFLNWRDARPDDPPEAINSGGMVQYADESIPLEPGTTAREVLAMLPTLAHRWQEYVEGEPA